MRAEVADLGAMASSNLTGGGSAMRQLAMKCLPGSWQVHPLALVISSFPCGRQVLAIFPPLYLARHYEVIRRYPTTPTCIVIVASSIEQ